MKTISYHIRKILSAERQENDFFPWKYESFECFSLNTGWKLSVEVLIRRIFFSKTSRGGGLCAVFLGCIDQFQNLYKGEGLNLSSSLNQWSLKLGVTCRQKDPGSKFLLPEGFGSFSRSGCWGSGNVAWKAKKDLQKMGFLIHFIYPYSEINPRWF